MKTRSFSLLILLPVLILGCATPSGCRKDAETTTTTPQKEEENMSAQKEKAKPVDEISNTVKISTKFGDMVVELNAEAAPETVANFKKLASEGFYNGTTFHRVIPGFMIQGGDPVSKDSENRAAHGTGSPGYTLPAEFGLSHKRGTLAMARKGDAVNPKKASNGSQFFICVADTPHLDDEYTAFGKVVEGMEVVDQIAAQQRDGRDNPLDRVEMKVSVVE